MEEFIEGFPDIKEAIFDGTERPVQRPKDAKKQTEHYSGKKKRHTRKHITGSTRQKRVIILTKARPGSVHDKRQLDEEDIVGNIPNEVEVEGDLGFQGLQNEFINVQLPHKKPRGKELTAQQKQEIREFSQQRVKCEHARAGIERYNAVTGVYRNRVTDFDDRLMLIATGLWNFYLDVA
ncbi:Transposase family protein [Tumidithrix helvetica PCC 7403]